MLFYPTKITVANKYFVTSTSASSKYNNSAADVTELLNRSTTQYSKENFGYGWANRRATKIVTSKCLSANIFDLFTARCYAQHGPC